MQVPGVIETTRQHPDRINKPYTDNNSVDDMIKSELGYKHHCAVANHLQRAARHAA